MVRALFSLAIIASVLSCSKEPPVFPSPAGKATATAGSVASDRAVLEMFYHATGGDQWNYNKNWLSDAPLDEWAAVFVNSKGRVTALWLTENGLRGQIPPQIQRLEKLEALYLDRNQLRGTIPSELGNLRNLRSLALRKNQLRGTIPSELGNLRNLELLELDNNQLRGTIPSELDNLTNLRKVTISENQLTGCLPASWQSASVQVVQGNLGLSFCSEASARSDRAALMAFYYATGGDNWRARGGWGSNRPMGDWFGVSVDDRGRVISLGLTGNDLTGSLPPELGDLQYLKTLYLSMNPQLTGSIPPQLGQLENLEVLKINGSSIGSLWGQLTGSIPPQLGQLENLRELNLSFNRLTGSIPPELGQLENLVDLTLSHNRLTGSIPPQLGRLSNLRFAILSGNSLTGCLPASWEEDVFILDDDLPFCTEGVEMDPSAFSIELVFLDNRLTAHQKGLVRQAADRWEEVIIGDVPDINFEYFPYSGRLPSPMNTSIEVEDTVDDLRLWVGVRSQDEEVMAIGGPFLFRHTSLLPVLSALALNPNVLSGNLALPDKELLSLVTHEIGHCLGFGTLWGALGLAKANPSPHFVGTKALRWFNLLGGENYRGRKVPTQGLTGHWKTDVFGDELMIHGWQWPYNSPLSIITVAAMEDIGYTVDWFSDDPYILPKKGAAKPLPSEDKHKQKDFHRILKLEEMQLVREDGQIVSP